MTDGGPQLTFGGHLEALRRMLMRMLGVALGVAVVVFCFKDQAFSLLLAPSSGEFCTWRWLAAASHALGVDLGAGGFHVRLISTELAAQFKTHVSVSLWLGLLVASPYVVWEVFRFVAPALYADERRLSARLVAVVYVLFMLGVALSYFVVFPVSFRFLGTYQVAAGVENQITLSSYVGTFARLTLLMGLLFQVPVVTCLLSRLGLVTGAMLRRYRRHAFLIISVVSAIITPPDVLSLILVATPICLLYEVSIHLAARFEARTKQPQSEG